MARCTINGAEYDLRLNLWAMKKIEEKYGNAMDAMKQFRENRSMGMLADLFVILANGGRKHAKLPTDIADDVLDDCSLADLSAISDALKGALDEGMHTETVGGGEADDSEQDALVEEYNQKNA